MEIQIKKVETEKEKEQALAIRYHVFVNEQNVPPEEEIDKWDDIAVHFLASISDQPVGTGRLRWLNSHVGKVERVAVMPKYRGTGVGKAIMTTMEAYARSRGTTEILLYAQTQAAAFYQRLGYQKEGDTFLDAGIEHIAMRKKLIPDKPT